MEINPLVITDTAIYILDFAAKLDSAADYIFQAERASLEYPAPFGRWPTPEEAKILEMDSKTGASLKVFYSEYLLFALQAVWVLKFKIFAQKSTVIK